MAPLPSTFETLGSGWCSMCSLNMKGDFTITTAVLNWLPVGHFVASLEHSLAPALILRVTLWTPLKLSPPWRPIRPKRLLGGAPTAQRFQPQVKVCSFSLHTIVKSLSKPPSNYAFERTVMRLRNVRRDHAAAQRER